MLMNDFETKHEPAECADNKIVVKQWTSELAPGVWCRQRTDLHATSPGCGSLICGGVS